MQQQLGSGKTAVLVERIINKIINEKIDIDKLLVVTFTNAAASEMRQRILDAIYKKIEEEPSNENLQRQITLLNKASICTIDSFCLEVVRNYFYELDNISPNFRIADTTQIELLKQDVIEEIFENKYENQDEGFIKLLHTYTSYKDDTPLKDLIIKIYTYIQSNPFPEKWLNEKVEMFNLKEKMQEDFSKTLWGENILQEIEEELIDSISSLQVIEEKLAYEPELDKFMQVIRDDIEKLCNLKNNLNNWDNAYEIAQNMQFITWPRQKQENLIKDNAKKIRDEVKKKINQLINKKLSCNSKQANEDIYEMYPILKKLENIIIEFNNEFSKAKREKNIVDFNDIEHMALKILIKQSDDGKLQKTEVAKQYEEKFEEIAIDEYQDSNLVQEYILTSISKGNNIFMVGDVKQSIYKFRQAMPELFLNKYASYKNIDKKTNNDDLKIQLFKNFRSRENILNVTNIIFENIMSSVLGDIEYNEGEFLNLGANFPNIDQNMKTEISIISLQENEQINENQEDKIYQDEQNDEEEKEEERIENIELEAKYVSNKINELIKNKYQVWDSKKQTYRNIEYKDIVILLRTTSKVAPIYEQELLNLSIPVFSDSSEQYLDTIEIQTVMNLLRIIDNPIQDIPLVAVLRSHIGKFTDDELIQIRLTDKYDNFYNCLQKAKINVSEKLREKIEKFLKNLQTWREEQEYLALDELIWKIYSDTGYYNYVGLMVNGELRQANLKMLFERAKQYETSSFKGLYNFIHFIDKLKLSSGDLGSAKIIGENDNVVRIMSIHKSKGLEFPVVFLSGTGKQFNFMDLNQTILLHQEMGIGVTYIDYEKQVQYDTLSKQAIKNKIKTETLSEEMRILYVALTRSKEKLFITALDKDVQNTLDSMKEQIEKYDKNKNKINPLLVKKYKRYIDWILLTYLYNQNQCKSLMDFNILNKNEILQEIKESESNNPDIIEIFEQKDENTDVIKEIDKIINYKYPYKFSTTIPTKTSVTQIKQNPYEELDYISFEEPKFMKKESTTLSGAQKGTLMHLCMQKLDFTQDYDINKIKDFVDLLVNNNIITDKDAQNINIYKLLSFTKSKIYKELKNAKQIYKEQPFYSMIPASDVYNDELVKEKILMQGIIDLYYIDKDDKLVLLDYKTDYVENGNEQELVRKYHRQLELYKMALETSLKRKVDKVYIYSIYLEKEILV